MLPHFFRTTKHSFFMGESLSPPPPPPIWENFKNLTPLYKGRVFQLCPPLYILYPVFKIVPSLNPRRENIHETIVIIIYRPVSLTHIFWCTDCFKNIAIVNFMAPFNKWGSTASWLQSPGDS